MLVDGDQKTEEPVAAVSENSRGQGARGELSDDLATRGIEGAFLEGEEISQDEDEDDPIVDVIDVYLRRLDEVAECGGGVAHSSSSSRDGAGQAASSSSSSNSAGASHSANVFVMQFPMRPSDRPYGDQGQLQQVAWRKQQQQLRLTYSLHSQGPNYDTNHPLHLQASASGGETCHVLRSQVSPASECSYAVGVLRKNKLFLTPVQQLLQFKPDFAAYESLFTQQMQPTGSGTQKRGTGAGGSATSEGSGSTAAETSSQQPSENSTSSGEVNPLSGTQAPQQLQATGEGRGRISNSRQRDIEESEPWIPIETFYDADSPEAWDLFEALCKPPKKRQEKPISTTEPTAMEQDGVEAETEEPVSVWENLGGVSDSSKTSLQAENAKQRQNEEPDEPDILFVSDVDAYLAALCSSGISSREGDGQSQANAVAAASGPLSFGVLSRLPLDQQVLQILRHLHIASFATIKRLLVAPNADDRQILQQLLQHAQLVQGNWSLRSVLACSNTYEIACRDLLLALLIRDAKQGQGAGLTKEAFRVATRLPAERIDEMLRQVATCSASSWRLKLPADTAFLKAFPLVAERFDAWWTQRLKQVVLEVQTKRDAMMAANYGNAGGGTGDGGRGKGSASPALLQLATRVAQELLRDQGALSLEAIKTKMQERDAEFATLQTLELENILRGSATLLRGVWVLRKLGNAHLDSVRSAIMRVFENQTRPLSKQALLEAASKQLGHSVELPDFSVRKILRELATTENGLWTFKGGLAGQEQTDDVAGAFDS